MRTAKPMVRVNVFFAASQWVAFKELAKQTGLTASEIVRRALDLYLASAKK